MQSTIITGRRHADAQTTPNGPQWRSPLAQPCYCGCGAVDGLAGYIVQDSDTPKLATLGLLIAEFPNVPYRRGPMRIAYSYAELGLTAPKPEEERHEAVRLFEPAPTQIAGQLSF